jgi:hypothetical protein
LKQLNLSLVNFSLTGWFREMFQESNLLVFTDGDLEANEVNQLLPEDNKEEGKDTTPCDLR